MFGFCQRIYISIGNSCALWTHRDLIGKLFCWGMADELSATMLSSGDEDDGLRTCGGFREAND